MKSYIKKEKVLTGKTPRQDFFYILLSFILYSIIKDKYFYNESVRFTHVMRHFHCLTSPPRCR